MPTLQEVYVDLVSKLPEHLYLFPLVAGSMWITTLTVMLGYWLATGHPTYPHQRNPYIAFISDIAAWHLKPFFVIGCTVTSIAFIGTVFSVHYARLSQHFYALPGSQSTWRHMVSTVTLVAGIMAGTSLFLLSVFDVAHSQREHRFLLICTFGGLGLSAVGTGLVWADVWLDLGQRGAKRRERIGATRRTGRLRLWVMINFALMLAIAALGALFIASLYNGWLRVAGVVEWIVAYVGCLWLFSFVAFFRPRTREDEGRDDSDDESTEDERAPLLDGD